MPRSKAEFDTLYPYRLYTPAELLDPDRMYTVPEIARMMQGLDPEMPLDEVTEDRIIQWTIPWLVANADDLVINDPEGDEPGYFGVRTGAADDLGDEEPDPVPDVDVDPEA
ncbi:MAG: DUF5827 family protein [Salinigranum sp.]